jgi:hypothetical protein
MTHLERGQTEAARKLLKGFHHHLCTTRILDPACGSGNFLYVAFGASQTAGRGSADLYGRSRRTHPAGTGGRHRRSPSAPGIEVNPRPPSFPTWCLDRLSPMAFPHPRQRHAADAGHPEVSQCGMPGRRTGLGRHGADPRRRRRTDHSLGRRHVQEASRYGRGHTRRDRPHPSYPLHQPPTLFLAEADYVVGNPPFIGNWRMRQALGDGYAERCAARIPTFPKAPIMSCTGGIWPENWPERAKSKASASSPPTACP